MNQDKTKSRVGHINHKQLIDKKTKKIKILQLLTPAQMDGPGGYLLGSTSQATWLPQEAENHYCGIGTLAPLIKPINRETGSTDNQNSEVYPSRKFWENGDAVICRQAFRPLGPIGCQGFSTTVRAVTALLKYYTFPYNI